MSYSPPLKLQNLKEIAFKQAAQYNILATDLDSNPHIFKKYQIVTDGVSPDMPTIRHPQGMITRAQRTAGVGFIKFGLYSSIDGITWAVISTATTLSDVLAAMSVANAIGTIAATIKFIAIGASNSDGATTGLIKDSIVQAMLQLPPAYSLVTLL